MHGRPTVKGHVGWMRERDRPPMRLDDLVERLGSLIEPIRAALGDEADLAVAIAHDIQDDDDVVLVATRSGVHVRHPWSDAPHGTPLPTPAVAPWATVRVSPVRSEGWQAVGAGRDSPTTHSCEVRIGTVTFLVTASGASGRWAVDGFHDEVVRRGTPWHDPS